MLDLVPSIGETTDWKNRMIFDRQVVTVAVLKESGGFDGWKRIAERVWLLQRAAAYSQIAFAFQLEWRAATAQ